MNRDIVSSTEQGVVKWVHGTFSVPEGSKGDPLGRATYQACKKFGGYLQKEGWTLLDVPTVTKIRVSNETRWKPKLSRVEGRQAINLWVPMSMPGVMRTDHPWVKVGEDQYEVAWKVSRRSRGATFDVPDRIIEKGLLPAGAKLVE